MKYVLAVVQPPKLQAIREALDRADVRHMTVCDAHGFARQRGQTALYRGHEYHAKLLRKIALEIVINEDFEDRTLNAIISVARTGSQGVIGDGKIFIVPVLETIQISDGSRGPGAV